MEEWFTPFSLVLYLYHNISSYSIQHGFSIYFDSKEITNK